MEKVKASNRKNEFLRLRIDLEEKRRLDKICSITRRQKSDIIRESLYDFFKSKYPECLAD
jgi:predicted transcriptional regulator